MSIAERISEVLPYIELQLARSFPVIDKGREVIFFYKSRRINQDHYTVPEIKYVVYRDISNGRVEKHDASNIIPEDLLSRVAAGVYSYPSDPISERENSKEYKHLYESIVSELTLNNPPDNAKIERLMELFGQLEQTAPVKEIYLFLAKDFFKELN